MFCGRPVKSFFSFRPGLYDPHTWEYDVFISHAGEIKLTVAEEVSQDLTRLGFKCFLDKESLHAGDAADKEMEKAAREAPIGLVLFDKHFVEKPYPVRELKIIVEEGTFLPVLIGITHDEFKEKLTAASTGALFRTTFKKETIEQILRTTMVKSLPNESPSEVRQRIQYAVLRRFVKKVCPSLPDTMRGLIYLLLIARALKTALSLPKLPNHNGDSRQIAKWYDDLQSKVRDVDNDRYKEFV